MLINFAQSSDRPVPDQAVSKVRYFYFILNIPNIYVGPQLWQSLTHEQGDFGAPDTNFVMFQSDEAVNRRPGETVGQQ